MFELRLAHTSAVPRRYCINSSTNRHKARVGGTYGEGCGLPALEGGNPSGTQESRQRPLFLRAGRIEVVDGVPNGDGDTSPRHQPWFGSAQPQDDQRSQRQGRDRMSAGLPSPTAPNRSNHPRPPPLGLRSRHRQRRQPRPAPPTRTAWVGPGPPTTISS